MMNATLAATDLTASRPLSVVMVLPTYLPESFGGAEQQSRKLALALGRLGVRTTILAPRLLASTAKREQEASVSLQRFSVRKAPNLGGRYLGSWLIWSAKLAWWLVRHRDDYDVIHIIHGRLHAVPAVLAAALLRKPSLVKIGRGGSEHFDLDIIRRKRLFGRWYAHVLLHHATAYVANSSEITDDLARWKVAPERVRRIPNGVDVPTDFVRPASTLLRFVYLGRLDSEKALDLMIRGFARLLPTQSAQLKIVGDGPCRAELGALVRQLGMQDRIIFTGAVSDVSDVLRGSDVFVSTSRSEGMSNALLEAMSFGVMPLVSLVSGVSDIVEDGRSGVLFLPGDIDAFAIKLAQVVEFTPERRHSLGCAARDSVAQRFGIDRVARSHEELYRQLINA